jgi:hypothetical protein
MPLNPQIPLLSMRPPGPQPLLPMDLEARTLGLRQLQRQDTAGNMDLEEKKRQVAEAQAIRDALQSSASIDEALSKIDKINPAAAAKFREEIAKAQKGGLDNEKTRGEISKQRAERFGADAQALLAIKDPAQRQQAQLRTFQGWQRDGLIDDKAGAMLPTQPFTDEELQQLAQGAMSVKDQLDLQDKQATQKRLGDQANEPKHVGSFTNEQGQIVDRLQYPDGRIEYRTGPKQGAPPQAPAAPYSDERFNQEKKLREISARAAAGAINKQDVVDVAEGIEDGILPPDLKGMYRNTAAIEAELKRRGFNLSQATTDWKAIQKFMSSLNGAQQLRLRQAAEFTRDSLPQLEEAYAEWKRQAGISGFKDLNHATLKAMERLPGKPGSAAHQLESLIADFTSELGTVYKGGNASTDESLRLAAENLKAEWNEQTFNDAIARLKKSLQIRNNSIFNTQPAGVSSNSPYLQGRGGNAGAGAGSRGPITEALIQANMKANPNAKRADIIEGLKAAGYEGK